MTQHTVKVNRFRANTPGLTPEHVVKDISLCKLGDWGYLLDFNTLDKYVNISTFSHYQGGNHSTGFVIQPWIETSTGVLEEGDPQYYDHPEYYILEMLVTGMPDILTQSIISLKYQYSIIMITNDALKESTMEVLDIESFA